MVQGSFRGMLLFWAQALDAQHRILRPPITLLLNAQFLLPQSGKESVFLLDGIETKALAEAHVLTVGMFFEQVLEPPFKFSGRLLGAAAEIHVVLHLETSNVVVKLVKIFVNSH